MQRKDTPHNRLVAKLEEQHGCLSREFHRLLKEAVCGPHTESEDCWHCYVLQEWDRPGFIPDAFRFDREASTVWIYEVEITHHISEYKFSQLEQLWWLLDNYYWKLRLIVVDRYGAERELCMDDGKWTAATGSKG